MFAETADEELRRSVDGIEEILFFKNPEEPRAAILILPAMGVAARYYRTLAKTLVERGYAVGRGEYRGHGKSPYRAGRDFDYGYRDLVEVSIPTWLDMLRERTPEVPVFLLGHSLGGHATTLFSSLPEAKGEGGKIDGMMIVASGSVDHRAWAGMGRDWIRARYGTQIVAFVARLLGHWPGDKFGFAGREARTLVEDWAQFARTGRWRLVGSERDWNEALAQVDLPFLAISLDRDDFAPKHVVDRLVALLPRADLTRIHLEEGEAPPQALTHFRWALEPDAVVERLDAWLLQLVDPQPIG